MRKLFIHAATLLLLLPACLIAQAQGKHYAFVLTDTPPQQVLICPWDTATPSQKLQLWREMSPRHQDYHWKRMSPDERLEFRSKLSARDQNELRHMYSTKRHEALDNQRVNRAPNHLSKQEREILREQVLQARQAQAAKELAGKTPAEAESDALLKLRLEQLNETVHTQIIILSLQKKHSPIPNRIPDSSLLAESSKNSSPVPDTPAQIEELNEFDN